VNFAYQFNFVRNLKARMRRKAAAWPGRYDLGPLSRVWSIRTFDDVYTAPLNGFGNATNYYHQASALRVVAGIRIPTLILSAADDPFVPPQQFDAPEVRRNPWIQVEIPRHGGHCAFVGAGDGHPRYWAEASAVDFLRKVVSRSSPP
jgi:predicted alpha/beta-fold hydrolase